MRLGDAYGIDPSQRFSSYEELLADPEVHAVHINTPIHLHAKHSLMALEAGKACCLHRSDGDDH